MHRTQLFAIGKPLGSFAHARLSTRICASYGEVSEGRLCLFRFGRLYKPGRDCQFADVLERRNPYGPLSVSIYLPPEAWATLRKNPQDRTEAVRVLVEQYGGRLLAFYYCFGEYDGVLLLEAPDDLAA